MLVTASSCALSGLYKLAWDLVLSFDHLKRKKKTLMSKISCVLVCAHCLLSLHWRYHCKESCSVIFIFSLWVFIYVNKTHSPF